MSVGTAGMYRLRPRCYQSDQNGTLGNEITDMVLEGEVSIDQEAEIPSTFRARLRMPDPATVPAWSWLRVFLRLSWFTPDGFEAVDEPVGHFQIMPPAEQHTAAMGFATIDGRDGCWLLKQWGLPAARTFAAGANVIAAVRDLIDDAGFAASRIQIPDRSNTFTKKRTYEAGTPRLEVINDLLYRVAYYPLWFDRAGIARSRRIAPRSKTEPRRTFASRDGDIVEVVELETDAERLVNRVTVIADDPEREPPIVVTKSNTRADSPASIPNLGFVKSKTINASNIDSTSEATTLANDELEKGASVERRIALATIPDPAFGFHETIRLEIVREDGSEVTTGTWRWDQLSLGLTPSQQPMRWRMSRVIPWED